MKSDTMQRPVFGCALRSLKKMLPKQFNVLREAKRRNCNLKLLMLRLAFAGFLHFRMESVSELILVISYSLFAVGLVMMLPMCAFQRNIPLAWKRIYTSSCSTSNSSLHSR